MKLVRCIVSTAKGMGVDVGFNNRIPVTGEEISLGALGLFRVVKVTHYPEYVGGKATNPDSAARLLLENA